MVKPLLKLKRSIKRLLKVKEDIDPKVSRTRGRILVKYLMAAASIILVTLLYPMLELFGPLDVPREGEIAQESIIADFSFDLPKSNDQLKEERRQAVINTPLYIDSDDDILQRNRSNLRRLATLSDSLHSADNGAISEAVVGRLRKAFPFIGDEWIIGLLRSDSPRRIAAVLDSILVNDIYHFGVLDDLAKLPGREFNSVLLRQRGRDLLMIRNQVLDLKLAFSTLLEKLNEIDARTDIDVDLYYEIGRHFVAPNAIFNETETEAARDSSLAVVADIADRVTGGDLLIRRGKQVDADKAGLLQAYAHEVQARAAERGWLQAIIPFLGRLVLVAAVIVLIYLFLFRFRPDVYWSNNKLFALLLIIGLELFLVNFIAVRLVNSVYLFPIAILSILVTVLFDSRLGVVMTLLVALLLGILNRFNFTIALITALAGMVACFSAGEIRRRSEIYRIIIFLSIAYVVIALVVESLKLSRGGDVLAYCGYGLANGFISPMLAIGILPMFESLFGFSTNITLLELADLNQPLLKRLSMEAPGTYHHSIVLGTLAEAAAKAIGANPLLARVGAYYHDIGKMEIPEYFVENQLGIRSKHESLNPTMSALVLASHVKKGRRLGEEAGLPDAILNFIEEHHGTTKMTYFLNKAREMGLPIESDQEFRYPGPKPQSKETAILMLADSTEAASRTLENPTSARIRNLIQKLINDKFLSGELTESALTLKDLDDIKEAFVSILIGVFHHRIPYPKKEDEAAR